MDLRLRHVTQTARHQSSDRRSSPTPPWILRTNPKERLRTILCINAKCLSEVERLEYVNIIGFPR
jgi:hypothetical protein